MSDEKKDTLQEDAEKDNGQLMFGLRDYMTYRMRSIFFISAIASWLVINWEVAFIILQCGGDSVPHIKEYLNSTSSLYLYFLPIFSGLISPIISGIGDLILQSASGLLRNIKSRIGYSLKKSSYVPKEDSTNLYSMGIDLMNAQKEWKKYEYKLLNQKNDLEKELNRLSEKLNFNEDIIWNNINKKPQDPDSISKFISGTWLLKYKNPSQSSAYEVVLIQQDNDKLMYNLQFPRIAKYILDSIETYNTGSKYYLHFIKHTDKWGSKNEDLEIINLFMLKGIDNNGCELTYYKFDEALNFIWLQEIFNLLKSN